MKKLVKLLLCAAICLPLFGCGSSKKGSDEFAEYAKTLPAVFMESTGFDTNFFFDHPEKYGIKKDLYTLQFMTLDDFKKQDKEYKKIDKALDDYDYDALTKDQKITYDVLKAALKDDENDKLTVEDRYYLTTNYFDVSSGIQSSLPFALWNYEFKNQKSLDSFIAVLNQAPKLFKKYAAFEVTRQKKGYGMSKTYMDNVIKSVHAINNSDQSYILNATYEKIDNADYIPTDKKQFYKDTITNAFNNKLLPAFKQTETDFKIIMLIHMTWKALMCYGCEIILREASIQDHVFIFAGVVIKGTDIIGSSRGCRLLHGFRYDIHLVIQLFDFWEILAIRYLLFQIMDHFG